MTVFEPLSQPGVDVPKMVYVSCFGSHTHPLPPPPECTLRKMQLLEAEVEADAKASSVVLRKRVEQKILQQIKEIAGWRKVHGTPHIPIGSGSRRIWKLRQAKRKVVDEAEGIISLAVDMDYPYCRDIKLVGKDIIVTCAHDAMLMHAARCTRFAADATYKTVTERTRKSSSGRWYLYNIVAPARPDGGNTIGVIVFRALVTGLSADVYRVVWRCFLRELISYSDIIRGEEVIGSGVLNVPYQQLPPALMRRSFYLTSVTTDLEAEEVQGYAQALADLCGGSINSHIAGMLIGCGVHLERDLRKRLRCPKIGIATHLSEEERNQKYLRFICAENETDAMRYLDDVHDFDPHWVKWVRHSGLMPLVCRAFSTMKSKHRGDGFTDTNVVESHNRRGNDIAGRHIHPYDAIQELRKLDELDIAKLNSGLNQQLRVPWPPRQRSDYILTPSGSKSGTGRKRRSSGGGMGPAAKRARTYQSRTASSSQGKAGDQDDEVEIVKVGKAKLVKKDGISMIVHLRVQQMLCCLDKKIAAEEGVGEETKDKRSTSLTTLLVAITKLKNDDFDELKSLILEARLAALRDGDRDFSYELFNVYSQGCVTKDPLPTEGAAAEREKKRSVKDY